MKRRELAQALLLSAGVASPLTSGSSARAAAEIAAQVLPTDYAYPVGDLRRYGGDPTGTNDSSLALQTAANIGLVLIAPNSSFKILTGANCGGRVCVIGFGPSSQLCCDSTVLTVNAGSDSLVDNLQLLNITEPWIITRESSNWASNISATLRRSNSEGYQPTVNDHDLWNTLSKAQQDQQIGPSIVFRGNASNITVRRVYGRFVQIALNDAQYSCVCDCNIQGGKGAIAAIHFWNVNDQVGRSNKALRNTVRYASCSGITFARNTDFQAIGNQCLFCGESGIKTWQGTLLGKDARCYRGQIQDNVCDFNYYDGIDAASSPPPDDSILTYHQLQGNRCENNAGDGINCNGQFNQISNNYLSANGRYGLWGAGLSRSKISGNVCLDNNQTRAPSQHDLGIVGKASDNVITDNWIWAGANQNNYGIYAPGSNFAAGNYAANGSRLLFGNDLLTGKATEQSFTLDITNRGGKLQNAFYSVLEQRAPGRLMSRIIGAETAYRDTPAGEDSRSAMAFGGKIGSAAANSYICNTAAQSNDDAMLMAQISYNDTGIALNVRAQLSTVSIDGAAIARLTFVYTLATSGAAFALNTVNIPAGKSIKVQFLGKLS